ncbi:MAG: DUF1080 domain-containing protein, partial [Alistipes sp.]|nr:DUF1080 domain-containing protein [Alistipes sp.]
MRTTPWIILSGALWLGACTSTPKPTEVLFNGTDLTGWTAYLQDSTADPQTEFVVRDGVIALSGKFGYIRTERSYANYRLQVEWRWPDSATNSGIFLQVAEDGIWPNGYECQLWNTHAGDLINSGGADCAIYRADTTQMIGSKRNASNEQPVGTWNQAEIECRDRTIRISINGELQNEITETS